MSNYEKLEAFAKCLPPGDPGLTPRELQAKYLRSRSNNGGETTTVRTIQRWLNRLQELDLATTVEKKEKKNENDARHWIATPQKRNRLSLSEAVAYQLIEQVAQRLLPHEIVKALDSQFKAARESIRMQRNVSTEARWTDQVRVIHEDFGRIPKNIDATILNTVQTALMRQKQIRCRYISTSSQLNQGQAREHVLGIHGLVQRGPVLYAIGTVASQETRKTGAYALHRFVSAELLKEPVRRWGKTLQEFIDHGGLAFGHSGQKIDFKARVKPDLAVALVESPLAENQTLIKNKGETYVRATLYQSWPFENWILSQAAKICVLEPPALRDKIAGILKTAYEQYQR